MSFTMPPHRLTSAALTIAAAMATLAASAGAQWTSQQSGTTASLRGLSVVDAQTAWASGTGGTVVVTTDGGASWKGVSVAGAAAFDLRSVHARSARVAHVAATAGRIWRTTDGGQTWSLRYQAADTTVFLDAIEFWDDANGVALGDPVDGHFLLVVTRDGGETWRDATLDERPAAAPGEAAFAASGTSMLLQGTGDERALWIGTGGTVARVHRGMNGGRVWVAYPTPMRQGGASEGIFSLAEVPGEGLLAVGGNYSQDDSTRANVARSRDGTSWGGVAAGGPRGYRSGVAFARVSDRPAIGIAVGPGGSDVSRDGGATWGAFDATGFHAVRASRDGIFFASGSGGRVARYDARSLR